MQKERKVMEHKMRNKERKSTSIMMKLITVRKVYGQGAAALISQSLSQQFEIATA